MSIDDILAGTDTVMTKELVRLFKVAGCLPTACHVCHDEIKPGDTFKLVSYRKTDEMCCAKHGKKDLGAQHKVNHPTTPVTRSGWGGFSRPSKGVPPEQQREHKGQTDAP